jgi:hypothetical protein
MKKVLMILSFALLFGVVAANAQDKKQEVKKAPAKKEAAAPAKEAAAPAKKETKKAATPAKKEAAKPATPAAAPAKK